MINARPGCWDLDSCSWTGVEPTYVVPPLRRADHAPERAVGTRTRVPRPRQDGLGPAEPAASPPEGEP